MRRLSARTLTCFALEQAAHRSRAYLTPANVRSNLRSSVKEVLRLFDWSYPCLRRITHNALNLRLRQPNVCVVWKKMTSRSVCFQAQSPHHCWRAGRRPRVSAECLNSDHGASRDPRFFSVKCHLDTDETKCWRRSRWREQRCPVAAPRIQHRQTIRFRLY